MEEWRNEPSDIPRPLPQGDRVWQHPSERGMVERHDSDRRRGARVSLALVVAGASLLVLGIAVGKADRNVSEVTSPSDRIGSTVVTIAITNNGRTQMATGIALDAQGDVLIRASLVDGADRLRAGCVGRAPSVAQLIGRDSVADVAVLKMSSSTCKTATTATTNAKVGEPVIAVRSAGEGAQLIWRSGTIRAADVDQLRSDGNVDHHVFRTDVSGIGPAGDGLVFSESGNFLGMVLNSSDTDSEVPVRPASALVHTATELAAGHELEHPWIGITADDLTSDAALVAGASGCTITAVDPKGPADLAGIRPGDIVISADSQPVRSLADLARFVHEQRVSDAIQLGVQRPDGLHTVPVIVANQPLESAGVQAIAAN